MPETSLGPLIILPFVFLGVGALFLFLSVRAWRTSRRQARWPSVSGLIRSADVQRIGVGRKKRDNYFPRIGYEYTVGGNKLTGEWTGVANGQGYTTERRAAALAAEFRPGSTVPVYYEEADPGQSTLRQGRFGFASFFMAFMGLLCVAVGSGVLWLFLALR